jgi:hypothetical protein
VRTAPETEKHAFFYKNFYGSAVEPFFVCASFGVSSCIKATTCATVEETTSILVLHEHTFKTKKI